MTSWTWRAVGITMSHNTKMKLAKPGQIRSFAAYLQGLDAPSGRAGEAQHDGQP
jgi:hypothetical protein